MWREMAAWWMMNAFRMFYGFKPQKNASLSQIPKMYKEPTSMENLWLNLPIPKFFLLMSLCRILCQPHNNGDFSNEFLRNRDPRCGQLTDWTFFLLHRDLCMCSGRANYFPRNVSWILLARYGRNLRLWTPWTRTNKWHNHSWEWWKNKNEKRMERRRRDRAKFCYA